MTDKWKKSLYGMAATPHSTWKITKLKLETSVLVFGNRISPESTRVHMIEWKWNCTLSRSVSSRIIHPSIQVSKWQKIGTNLDGCWASSSSIFQLMSRLTPLTDLKWTHIHSETPLWCGPLLNNHEARRLRDHLNGCLESSSKRWPINNWFHRNLSHPWFYVLGCISGGHDNSKYIGM